MPEIINIRRDLHMYPELGWAEYRTTSKIIEFFEKLKGELAGEAKYLLVTGDKAIDAKSRLTPPSKEKCAKEKARAIIQGANPRLVEAMGDGLTGLWVDMHFGQSTVTKPVLALRFDIDANEVCESARPEHFPAQHGFMSQNSAVMHACGHDGHTAIGLGLAKVLHHLRKELADFPYIIRLIFQPAEEIAQGAHAMLSAGVTKNVELLYGLHLGIQARNKHSLICGTTHFLANTSFEVNFTGKAAHSGLAPHEGRNALLAACNAVQGLHAISRHGEGQSRVNVGQMHCYGAPNVVPSKAFFAGETRGLTEEINAWITNEAMRICQAAAQMWACEHSFKTIGHCVDGYSDLNIAEDVQSIAEKMSTFQQITLCDKFWASEDFTWLLQNVQKSGGQGTYIQLGIEWGQENRGHHTESFNFDEPAMERALMLLTKLVLKNHICA